MVEQAFLPVHYNKEQTPRHAGMSVLRGLLHYIKTRIVSFYELLKLEGEIL